VLSAKIKRKRDQKRETKRGRKKKKLAAELRRIAEKKRACSSADSGEALDIQRPGKKKRKW
jgi:hypothetical protein